MRTFIRHFTLIIGMAALPCAAFGQGRMPARDSAASGTLFGAAEFLHVANGVVKAEARYHLVSDAFGVNPDGLALSVGLKKYF